MRTIIGTIILACLFSVYADAKKIWIAEQVSDVKDGTVRLKFETREGVCGDGRGSISIHENNRVRFSKNGHSNWDYEEYDCEPGPARLELKIRRGRVVDLQTEVGGDWRRTRDDVVDLGEVSPQDAVDFLLQVAETGRESVTGDAVFASTLARDVVIWPRLLEIARGDDAPKKARKSCVFWLGQLAGEKITEGLAKIVDDDDMEIEVRKSAIFALSQQRHGKRVDALVDIARTNRHPQLRKSALFWLAQSDDPAVLRLFEEILTN